MLRPLFKALEAVNGDRLFVKQRFYILRKAVEHGGVSVQYCELESPGLASTLDAKGLKVRNNVIRDRLAQCGGSW